MSETTTLKPEDVKPGMRFIDASPRSCRQATLTVERVEGGYAFCRGLILSRIRLDRLTNPEMYQRVG